MKNLDPEQPQIPGLSKDEVQLFPTLKTAIWATFLSFLSLTVTQCYNYKQNLAIENKKRESELIKQALTPGNQQAEQNLIFLVRSGLVDCKQFNNSSSESPEIPADVLKKYESSLGNKNKPVFEFTEDEKKCNLIRALIALYPRGFGNSESPSNALAEQYEINGWTALIKDDIETAKIFFQKAYDIYPTLHGIDEINQLLKSNESNNVKLCIIAYYDTQNLTYSWSAPQEYVMKLRKKYNKESCKGQVPQQYQEGFK